MQTQTYRWTATQEDGYALAQAIRGKKRMRKLMLASCLGISMVSTSGFADQLEGIVPFENNTPADANDVNNNNLILSDKAQDLDARVRQLEDVSTRLIREDSAARFSTPVSSSANTGTEVGGLRKLDGGKLLLDNIDCTADPHALNRAYIEYSRFKDITFIITGDCYGDYTLRDPEDPSQGFIQEFGQSIGIQGNIGENGELPFPRLIPHPISGYLSLVGSFGGGLYLRNLEIIAPDFGAAVLYSRGATGSMSNVNIQCGQEAPTEIPSNSTWSQGIRVQNGAVPYLEGNISIKGCRMGLWALNGSTVALYGDLAVEYAREGMTIQKNSSATLWLSPNRDATIDIENTETAIIVSDSVVQLGWPGTNKIMDVGGDISIRSSNVDFNATLQLLDPESTISIENSDVSMALISSGSDATQTEAYLDNTALANRLTCSGNSVVDVHNKANSTLIPISQCWDKNDWNQHINPPASTP
jgi:hypothetical protein